MPTCKFRFPASLSLFILPLAFCQSLLAGWSLDGEASSLFYVTSKASAVSELNTFGELSGSIADNGNASVSISLGSVNTAIEIRDERMREFVFQVATYPLATVTLSADAAQLRGLSPGDSIRSSYEAMLDLHGTKQPLTLELVVTRLNGGGLLVALARPLILNAATFGLAEGVEQLRGIAGLPSINNNVVVDFTLQFDAD